MIRLWRSRATALTIALLAFALVAAACTSSTSGGDEAETTTTTTSTIPEQTTTTTAPETTTATTEAKPVKPYGGETIVGGDEEPPTLNPLAPGGGRFIVSTMGQAYLTGVQEIDGFTLELIPELVTELPTTANGGVVLNDDGTMTVSYTIKEEAFLSHGREGFRSRAAIVAQESDGADPEAGGSWVHTGHGGADD